MTMEGIYNNIKFSSLTWLWILLGVLGGLAILGVVGFFIYTKFLKKN